MWSIGIPDSAICGFVESSSTLALLGFPAVAAHGICSRHHGVCLLGRVQRMAHPYDFYVTACRSIPTLHLVSAQCDERAKIRGARRLGGIA